MDDERTTQLRLHNESQLRPKPTTTNRTKIKKHRNQHQQDDNVTTHSMYHDHCGIGCVFNTLTLLGGASAHLVEDSDVILDAELSFVFLCRFYPTTKMLTMTDNTDTNTNTTNDTQHHNKQTEQTERINDNDE